MTTTLSLDTASALALFAAMALLAAVPSVSVMTVTARAASHGFAHGVATTAGIVAGDAIFILIAILGLSTLGERVPAWLGDLLRIVGGAYLIWLGYRLLRANTTSAADRSPDTAGRAGFVASFMAGLLLTLADQKAVLFYLAFFPAFMDLSAVSTLDTLWVLLIASLAVGGVKLLYARAASHAGTFARHPRLRWLPSLSGGLLLILGVLLILRA